jgi:hypothetical protein
MPSLLLVDTEGDEIDRVQSVTEDIRLQDFYEAISRSRRGHCAASSDNQADPG